LKVFDPTKPVQTRDGYKARILCADLVTSCGWTIASAYMDSGGKEALMYSYADGRVFKSSDNPLDLVNVPERREVTHYVKMTGGNTPYISALKSSGAGYKLQGELTYIIEDDVVVDVKFTPEKG
jgi:hypothetical protein